MTDAVAGRTGSSGPAGPDRPEDEPTAPTERIGGAHPGRTEFGRVDIDDDVVARIAAEAASEVADAGSAASGMLGRTLAQTPTPGVRRNSLAEPPKVSAEVDGALVRLDLVLGVRWGASVPAVVTRVRERVGTRVAELTGLTVTDIDVEVVELISPERPPRAR